RIAVGEIPRVVEGGRYLPFVELIDPIEPVYLVEAVLPPCWGLLPILEGRPRQGGEGGEVDPLQVQDVVLGEHAVEDLSVCLPGRPHHHLGSLAGGQGDISRDVPDVPLSCEDVPLVL